VVLYGYMTEKITPIEQNIEENPKVVTSADLETIVSENEATPTIDAKTQADIKALEYQIKFAESPTGITNKKETGGEQEGIVYNLPKIETKPKSGLKTAGVALVTLFMSLFANKQAKAGTGPEDSLGKKPLIEKVSPADSVQSKTLRKGFEQTRDAETVGKITIEGHIYIPQKDTTKEFYSYHFSENEKNKNALGEILSIMKSKGFEPANGEMLEKIYKENENNIDFIQKIKWLMAPTPELDGDDTRAREGFMVTKNGKTSYAIPEHSVFPTKNPKGLGRFELDQGFEVSEYGILFYKKIEK